jgi:hypothetical protein
MAIIPTAIRNFLMRCYQVIFMFTPQGSGMQVALSTSRTADRPGGAMGRRRPARQPNKDGVAMSGPQPACGARRCMTL